MVNKLKAQNKAMKEIGNILHNQAIGILYLAICKRNNWPKFMKQKKDEHNKLKKSITKLNTKYLKNKEE